jgi:hypothetical protein
MLYGGTDSASNSISRLAGFAKTAILNCAPDDGIVVCLELVVGQEV